MFNWKGPILAVMGDYLVLKKVFDLVLMLLPSVKVNINILVWCWCFPVDVNIICSKNKILMFTLTGQGNISTIPKSFSTILGNWMAWGVSKKPFGLVLMFPLKRQLKVENNWKSTNNLKPWLLNISRDFLLCKIIASYAVDT